MFTKNYLNAIREKMENSSYATYSDPIYVTTWSGDKWEVKRGYLNNVAFFDDVTTVLSTIDYNGYRRGVAFGDGTGEVSENDYMLFGNVIRNLVCTQALRVEQNGNAITKKIIYTITNGNSEDVTISEIGYFNYVNYVTGSNTSDALYDHTLLDSPVTIPAGGIGQVTYTITFNIA